MSDDLSAYEKERLENIRRNEAKLAELDALPDAAFAAAMAPIAARMAPWMR